MDGNLIWGFQLMDLFPVLMRCICKMLTDLDYFLQLKQLKKSLEYEIRSVTSDIRVLGGLINRTENNNLAKHQAEKIAHKKSLQRILNQVNRNLEVLPNGQV